MKILVTGSSGFVGRSTCLALDAIGFDVLAFSRTHLEFPQNIDTIISPSFSSLEHSSHFFDGVDCVLHCAGRAHIMRETVEYPLTEFRNVNVTETLRIARLASVNGVRRFIYLSTAKVHGEVSEPNILFSESDQPNPLSPYSISKSEAEYSLSSFCSDSGMELVIVRPPLIYGPGVKGNFLTLSKIISHKIPLPLASISENRRSFLFLLNLISFLKVCILSPVAAGHTFLVSDQFDVSTSYLLTELSHAMDLSCYLFPCPPSLLKLGMISLGKSSLFNRLCSSFAVDSSLASAILDWNPPFSFHDGLSFSCSSLFTDNYEDLFSRL